MTVDIRVGDALTVLRTLSDASAQMCVTSPPYWGLRDYGVDGQLGLEATPDAYVAAMVGVFREVRRVLADDGTLWVNLGDSYAGSTGHTGRKDAERVRPGAGALGGGARTRTASRASVRPKDLVGIPWRVAFALQADGWYLRSDIIWHKPNPMPESVTDRPTKAHEYLFLLAKQGRYYYDADAIREPASGTAHARGNGVNPKARTVSEGSAFRKDRAPRPRSKQNRSFSAAVSGLVDERNKRSVWTVASEAFRGAHFATFPPKLIEPCILAGSRRGDTVLDPFGGAGTAGLVADRLGRSALLIEINPAYAAMAANRVRDDAPLFAAGDE